MKDVFLSHAHLDKEPYVRPFARELDHKAITYWMQEELEQYIEKNIDISRFSQAPQWGPEYFLVTQKGFAEEGVWIFWNKRTSSLEKWSSDPVRWYGPERLSPSDLKAVASLLMEPGGNG